MAHDISRVNGRLWVGAAVTEVPPGIDGIVNLTGGGEPGFRLPAGQFVRLMLAPIPDGPFRGLDWLDATADTVIRWLAEGLQVLIHCQAGISRAALVATAVLMKLHGWSRDVALEAVRVGRPQVMPNPNFLTGLEQYERRLRKLSRAGGGGEDPRILHLLDYFGTRLGRVLELGSLDGRQTFAIAHYAEHVTAVEGRLASLEQAERRRAELGVRNVDFRLANLETDDLAAFGPCDLCVCVGLLYHLPRPWELLTNIALLTDRLFLWTHYTTEETYEARPGLWGIQYREHGPGDPLSGLSAWSFWPTLDGLRSMLTEAGFTCQTLYEDDAERRTVTLAAEKEKRNR